MIIFEVPNVFKVGFIGVNFAVKTTIKLQCDCQSSGTDVQGTPIGNDTIRIQFVCNLVQMALAKRFN